MVCINNINNMYRSIAGHTSIMDLVINITDV